MKHNTSHLIERDFRAARDLLTAAEGWKETPKGRWGSQKSDQLRCLAASLIDGTSLNPTAAAGTIDDLASLAINEKLRAICVPSVYLDLLPTNELLGAGVSIATVVNFPNGYSTLDAVLCETERAIRTGATEIDFVQPLYQVKNQAWRRIEAFSRTLVSSFPGVIFKSILETSYLSIPEIQTSVRCHALAGVHIIKTNTGYGSRGASVEDVQTIRNTLQGMGLGKSIGIKASGGIGDLAKLIQMVEAGATRIGTSRLEAILEA